ncbi:MAG: hypothetical protein ACR2OJ_01130 [Hyphomicrobiales bacterium]
MSAETTQITLSEEELKRRKWRNITIGVVCVVLVILFYVVTIVKLAGNIAQTAG